MAQKSNIIRGPWPAREADPGSPAQAEGAVGSAARGAPKMMLGFLVRECSRALGHEPSARELADWANHQRDGRGNFCLFGRAITVTEARLILAHPGREVTVRPERIGAFSAPPGRRA